MILCKSTLYCYTSYNLIVNCYTVNFSVTALAAKVRSEIFLNTRANDASPFW